jgi:hypothetical protein
VLRAEGNGKVSWLCTMICRGLEKTREVARRAFGSFAQKQYSSHRRMGRVSRLLSEDFQFQ